MAVTDDAVWVTSSNANHVVRLDAKTNQPGRDRDRRQALLGTGGGFWQPVDPELRRSHSGARGCEDGRVQATIAAGPADSEGGIAMGAGSVWIVTSKESDLVRIDPATNRVVAQDRIPPGSFNPVFANGSIWVSSNAGNAGSRGSRNQYSGRLNSGRAHAAISHRGRRIDLGSEPGRRHHCARGCGQRQADCGHPAEFPAWAARLRLAMTRCGPRSSIFPSPESTPPPTPCTAMARRGRRQHPLWPRFDLAHQLFGRKGLAAACSGEVTSCKARERRDSAALFLVFRRESGRVGSPRGCLKTPPERLIPGHFVEGLALLYVA